MARAPSKIMSIADKKVAQAGLKTALKAHGENVKAVSAEFKLAEKTLATAKKAADAMIKQLNKEQSIIAKKIESDLKAAHKVFDAAAGKAVKQTNAATKGHAKLTSQMAAIDAMQSEAPAVKAAKAPKAVAVAVAA